MDTRCGSRHRWSDHLIRLTVPSTGPEFQSVVSPAVTASQRWRPASESSACFYAQTKVINSPDAGLM